MASRKDDPFGPKLAPPRSRGSASPRFMSRVLKAASQAGPIERTGIGSSRKPKGAIRGRGFVAAKMAGRSLAATSRRVAVKTRLVNLRKASARSTSMHFRYLEREGVTPTGELGQAYGAVTDEVDTTEFHDRGKGDRHQFRFIVSAEEAAELGDLKPFTRAFMARMETDLGTHLDWLAVDHWDTSHPHTHIVLRGREQGGENLVIAREYIAHGMRARASEIATEWLGPRTQREIDASLAREVSQDRWTSLDAAIERQLRSGQIDLTAPLSDSHAASRALMVARLNHLRKLGLARQFEQGVWQVDPEAPTTLRIMAERGDIIRTMQRALGRTASAYRHFDPQSSPPLTGRVAAKGLHGEHHEQGYLVVEGLDGRDHYATLATDTDLKSIPVGAIVEVRGAAIRTADRNILIHAHQGIYRTDDHLQDLQRDPLHTHAADALVQSHVRRLEALRRAGVVDRISEGVWKIPDDLPEQGRAYDLKRLGGATVEIQCHLPIERQTKAIGATWLDQQLVKGSPQWPTTEFGAGIQKALEQREDFLVDQALARRIGSRIVLVQNLLATLRDREVTELASRVETTSHLLHRPTVDGVRVSGVYRESIQLTSGRFAMLDDGVGFSLVPWRPVIEKRLGQHVSAVVDGPRVNWELGRSRSRSL